MLFESKLLNLPLETLEFTLLHTEPSALASLSQSCRSLNYFIYHTPSDIFWKLYFLQYFDDPTELSHDVLRLGLDSVAAPAIDHNPRLSSLARFNSITHKSTRCILYQANKGLLSTHIYLKLVPAPDISTKTFISA